MTEKSQQNNTYDVVVIGGGSAGLCAAVAAARMGSKVALVEKSNRLGGAGPLAFVHTFCGLYMPDTNRPPRIANPGLPEEIESAMRKRTGQEAPTAMGRVYVLHQHPAIYDQLGKELAGGEESLDLMLESSCVGASRSPDGTFVVTVDHGGGQKNILCRSLVDGSADAMVAEFLGATRRRVDDAHLQKPAFIFSLKNVGAGLREDHFHMRLALDLVHAVGAGELPREVLGATIRASALEGECFVSVDFESLLEAREMGEALAIELCDFLRGKYPFFEDASGPVFPDAIGVRESFRWAGQYELTKEDLVEGCAFDDVIAYATWPLEMRETATGARFTFFNQPEPSGIPLRCLVSKEVPGVYFAGRCLSATHEALASVRVMGTCFATGQAAGMAASLHAGGEGVIAQQAQEIQQRLWGDC